MVHPCQSTKEVRGKYLHPATVKEMNEECNIISVTVESDINKWQKRINAVFKTVDSNLYR